MKTSQNPLKGILIVLTSLAGAFVLSLLFQYIFDVQEHITTVFVFAVFLTSLLTQGYLYGLLAAVIGTFAVNYAFAFPYFAVDFTTPVNLFSGAIMIAIAVLTSALTTKLKQQEAIKAESEKERMRANLLRAVSHDLRTPLTTIYASATTLLENRDMMTDEQCHSILTGITEDAEWLVRMVENLLSITRIDCGQVKIVKSPTVLEELIDAVMCKFKKHYPSQQVSIDIPDDILIVPMDAMLIEQVLINLLDNAVQHARKMTRLNLHVYELGNQVIFEVKDNGCGIDPKRLDTLFSGYHSSENALVDTRKNAGIGLSVCATIIHAHGGTIHAENLKSGGALFRFTLNTEDIHHDTQSL